MGSIWQLHPEYGFSEALSISWTYSVLPVLTLFLKGLFSIVCRSFEQSIKNPSQDYDLQDAAANCKQVASTPTGKCCWNVQSCPFYPRFSISLNSAINFALAVYAGKQRAHFHINNKYIKLCLVSYSITIMLMKIILYLYVPSLL